jgi:hypothetical protein
MRMRRNSGLLCVVVMVVGCGSDPETSPDATDDVGGDAAPDAAPAADAAVASVRLADTIVEAPAGDDATAAVNGVRGGGTGGGSVDVYSLGYAPGDDALTLAWSGGVLENGAGADLAVFENPFLIGGGPDAFMDLVIVEVSRDGSTWRALAHDYTNADEGTYTSAPAEWRGFAGRTPVLLHAEDNPVDPFDRALAGGDGFDLDDVVGDDAEAIAIRAHGAAFVRLVSAPARTNPDTGAAYVRDPLSNGGDIDGVYGRYVVAAP